MHARYWSLSISEIFVTDETISFRVTLKDALDKALCAVVLLISSLVELVGSLGASLGRVASSCHLLRSSCLTTTSLVFFRNGRESSPTTTCDSISLVSFDLSANISNHDFILAKVDSIKCLQSWNPNLELSSESVIFGGLACEHGVDRVLYQVKMLQLWILHIKNRRMVRYEKVSKTKQNSEWDTYRVIDVHDGLLEVTNRIVGE